MGQNNKIGKSSYIKITIPISEKEKLRLYYEAVSNGEIKANKKQERLLFVYQLIFIMVLIMLAFIKEKFFPSHIEWVEWIMRKF